MRLFVLVFSPYPVSMGKEDEIIAAPPFEEAHISKDDTNDLEKHDPSGLPQLKRRLKSRHLQMIAIGKTSSHLVLLW